MIKIKQNNLSIKEFRGFNLNKFKTILQSSQQINYAEKYLPKLGEGYSRIVFGLGSGKVLKIQKNDLIKQNKVEVLVYKNSIIPKECFAKIYAYDDKNYSWIISEAVQSIEDHKHLLHKFNINDTFLTDFVKYSKMKSKTFEEVVEYTKERYNKSYNDENIIQLNDFDEKLLYKLYILSEYNIYDIDKFESWGMTMNKNIVVIDAGI